MKELKTFLKGFVDKYYWSLRRLRLCLFPWPNNFKLDYLIIGEARSGTTFLFGGLIQHPQVVRPKIKEIHFFDAHYPDGLDWYKNELNATNDRFKFFGEATPYYLSHPLVPERVKRHFPKAKIIVLFRDPVKRAYSHYHHHLHHGFDKRGLSFEEADRGELEIVSGEVEKILRDPDYQSYPHRYYSFLNRGRYAEHLENWLRYFPREQFLFIQSEDLYRRSEETFAEVCNFLGLDTRFKFNLSVSSLNNLDYPPMEEETKRELQEYFRSYNQRLYKLVGRDFDWE